MNRNRLLLATMLTLITASSAFATSFVMPTDDELIQKSLVIVTGSVQGSHVEAGTQTMSTVYDVVVDRPMKGGPKRGEMIQVVSPGGFMRDVGVVVPGSAHFERGENVLLFLIPTADGRWQPTDMTLGKFRASSNAQGGPVYRRDHHGAFDRHGRPARDNARNGNKFLRYIEERVAGQPGDPNYEEPDADGTVSSAVHVEDGAGAGETTQPFSASSASTAYRPATYTDNVGSPARGIRWATMANGLAFYKRSGYNISGASDGGAGAIVNGLAAWTNECGSSINLSYGGENSTASRNYDGINIVEYNDPQGRVGGSWSGSGTIAITFLSFTSEHSFAGEVWWSITDADVVFQDNYTAANAAFAAAMTHELGHGIGFRHSNEHYIRPGACDPSVEECTTAAIMNSSVAAGYGYTLQTWDVNAARAVYPGGACNTPPCTPPSITQQPQGTTITQGQSATLSLAAGGTAPLSVQWYYGPTTAQSAPINGATGSTLTVTPSQTTTYWARVSNACGTADTNFVTVTVNAPAATAGDRTVRRDFNGDTVSDIFWHNAATRQNALWYMNGSSNPGQVFTNSVASGWTPVSTGDYNGDGIGDVFWRHTNGQTAVWLMNGSAIIGSATLPAVDGNWKVIGSGDFNADGRSDVFWHNAATRQNAIWFMQGLTTNSLFTEGSPAGWAPATIGDFDGNGTADVFWRNASTSQTAVWLMNGTAISGSGYLSGVGSQWQTVGSGDFDGDGRADLFWFNTSTRETAVWLMNGAATRSQHLSVTPASGWTPLATGDYNGDGRADVFWRHSGGQTAIWFMNGAALSGSILGPTITDPNWSASANR